MQHSEDDPKQKKMPDERGKAMNEDEQTEIFTEVYLILWREYLRNRAEQEGAPREDRKQD